MPMLVVVVVVGKALPQINHGTEIWCNKQQLESEMEAQRQQQHQPQPQRSSSPTNGQGRAG